jgi:hypothetical protein
MLPSQIGASGLDKFQSDSPARRRCRAWAIGKERDTGRKMWDTAWTTFAQITEAPTPMEREFPCQTHLRHTINKNRRVYLRKISENLSVFP